MVGYQDITGHMIFDIEMEDNFRHKVIFVADGNKTKTNTSVTCSTVVSRDSVRIYLKFSALGDLKVLADDAENTFLASP